MRARFSGGGVVPRGDGVKPLLAVQNAQQCSPIRNKLLMCPPRGAPGHTYHHRVFAAHTSRHFVVVASGRMTQFYCNGTAI